MMPQPNRTTFRATLSLGSRGSRLVFAFVLAASSLAGGLLQSKRTADKRAPAPGVEAAEIERKAGEAYGSLSLSFEENRGQAAAPVDFLARGAGYTIALSPAEAVLTLARKPADSRPEPPAVLRMRLAGADGAAASEGVDALEGRVNYFVGNDPSRWRTNVRTFGRVRYAGVYPGVDVIYYGNRKQLEYDFRVAPGADARAIALEFAGARKVELDGATGDLLLSVGEETVRQHAPVTYQETAGGGRREVESRYALRDGGRVGFEVGEYDRGRALVIDPTLVYSTFFGGSGDEAAESMAVDSAGNAYITGTTYSTNFPATAGAFDTSNNGSLEERDAFVMKLNSNGSGLVYATYLGGDWIDQGYGIAVDAAGNAYLTGQTYSTNFPTTPGAFDTNALSSNRPAGFVTKLSANGSNLLYSTLLKGTGVISSRGEDIAVDASGNAYVVGSTTDVGFPTTAGAFDTTNNGSLDVFVTKLNPNGSALVYPTLIGGAINDTANAIALDAAGNAFVTGSTESGSTFPTTAGAFDAASDGGDDGFVTKIKADGSSLIYSTRFGGSDNDFGEDIALDADGNAYVTGLTESTDFPTTCGAYDTTLNEKEDVFVTKLNPTGTALVYSTYPARRRPSSSREPS